MVFPLYELQPNVQTELTKLFATVLSPKESKSTTSSLLLRVPTNAGDLFPQAGSTAFVVESDSIRLLVRYWSYYWIDMIVRLNLKMHQTLCSCL